MAECLPSSSDLRAERTFAEINQELQLQLEKYKQDFRDLTEKFLVSQATAYSLANHLQKYSDTWEDCHQEPVSFPASEVPTSQAQLQKSTHVTDCLQWQLDQHLDCGDSKAILGLSSTNWGFTTNPDSGNQGPLFLELDASIRMKNPPKLEGEGSTASTPEHPVCKKIKGLSVLKQKILRRKLLFSKWRLACTFPGLQA